MEQQLLRLPFSSHSPARTEARGGCAAIAAHAQHGRAARRVALGSDGGRRRWIERVQAPACGSELNRALTWADIMQESNLLEQTEQYMQLLSSGLLYAAAQTYKQ